MGGKGRRYPASFWGPANFQVLRLLVSQFEFVEVITWFCSELVPFPKLTYPLKNRLSQKETIAFQPSNFSCKLAVSFRLATGDDKKIFRKI